MFKTVAETVKFINELKPMIEDVTHAEIVIAPPFPSLAAAAEAARGSKIRIGAQNMHWEEEGAFTGEVSASMVKGAGCTDVIIGHSERRQYFHETDETVNLKLKAALKAGLRPIVCCGETLEQREAGQMEALLLQQFEGAVAELTEQDFSRIIVAYEPIWAIGTGRTATPETAEEAHVFIRERAADRFGKEAAEGLRILYGGSVKPANIQGLMEKLNIDGALVGGASLEPASMAAIVRYPG
jgi:triosephosphate isomerase